MSDDLPKTFASMRAAVEWYLEPIDDLLSMIAEREQIRIGGEILVYGHSVKAGLLDTMRERFLCLQDWCRRGYKWVGPGPLDFTPPKRVAAHELTRRRFVVQTAAGYGYNFQRLFKLRGMRSHAQYFVNQPVLDRWRLDVKVLRNLARPSWRPLSFSTALAPSE